MPLLRTRALDRGRGEIGENLMFCELKYDRVFKKTTSILALQWHILINEIPF